MTDATASEERARGAAMPGTPAPPHPDAARWRDVTLLSLIAFVLIGGSLTSLSVYLLAIGEGAGALVGNLGFASSAMLYGMSFGTITSGWAIGRIGARPTIAAGIVLLACGWLAAGRVGGVAAFALTMGASGLGIGLAAIVPGVTIITRRFVARRGLAMAIFIGACALSSSILPWLSGELIGRVGWRASFSIAGIVFLLCLPLLLLVDGGRARAPEPGATSDAERRAEPVGARGGDLSPSFCLFTLAIVLSQLATYGLLFNTVAALIEAGLSRAAAIAAYSTTNFIALPAVFAGGALADRYGPRVMLLLALVLQGVGTFALLATMHGAGAAGLVCFVLLWGVAGGTIPQLIPMVLAEAVPQPAFPRLYGLNSAVANVVGAAAPLIGALILARRGGLAPVIALWDGLALLAVATLLLAGWRQRAERFPLRNIA